MTISFQKVPLNLRTHGVYQEIDPSAANSGGGDNPKTLIVGQKIAAGTAVANVPVQCTSLARATVLGGLGSMLYRQAKKVFENDPFGEVWLLPLGDAGGGVQATGTITVTAAATGNGTIRLYVGGQLVEVAVENGDTVGTIATAIVAAITAALDLPVTAAEVGAVVTVTARNDGTFGNQIDLRVNYRDDEELPSGVALTIVQMAAGATDPTLTTAIAGLGSDEYDYIVFPYNTDTPLDVLGAYLDDDAGAWDPMIAAYPLAFTAYEDTVSNLSTHGNGRNDPFVSMLGINDVPTWIVEVGAAYGGACARQLKLDPKRPLQTVEIKGVLAPPRASRFTATERNTLLFDGLATQYVGPGDKVMIDRAITTYQLDVGGNADDSFLDVTTPATLRAILRDTKTTISGTFPRHKLASEGFPISPGQAVVVPSSIKAVLVSRYRVYMQRGWCENIDGFIENLIVERDTDAGGVDPNRVNVLHPPQLLGGLVVTAIRQQFRLKAA